MKLSKLISRFIDIILNLCRKNYEEYWNTKRPYKDIVYAGRYFPFSNSILSIPVQLYVTPNDTKIIDDIKRHNLGIKDKNKCDDDIVKIYKHTRIKPLNPYRYEYDSIALGVPEFWYFPFELREADSADCDDWGNELASYLIAPGVPNFRVRCVAGTCWAGGGHLTVYVLSDDMKTWYHLNSTTGYNEIKDKIRLSEFPKSNNPNDIIGIKDVWFSYNNEHSWSNFETKTSEEEFKNFIKNILIKEVDLETTPN